MFRIVNGRFVKRLFVVLVCDLAGGVCFENKRSVVFVVALRAAFFEYTRCVVFVCVALRAALTVDNHDFPFCSWRLAGSLDFEKTVVVIFIDRSPHIQTPIFDLSIKSMLELLFSKNAAE